MKVDISPEAEQYILQNGKAAIILFGSISDCCGGTAPVLQIHLESPKDLSKYEQIKIKEIILYLDKHINEESQINITLAKLLMFKKLWIEMG